MESTNYFRILLVANSGKYLFAADADLIDNFPSGCFEAPFAAP